MDDCIFCKVIKGESPSYKVFEDEDFYVFLSIHPLTRGHCLVAPKVHYRWVWDSPNIGKYFEMAQKVVKAQKKAFETGFVIGAQVGDEVHHAHIQLIPRYPNDGHGDFITPGVMQSFSTEEMNEIAKMITENL